MLTRASAVALLWFALARPAGRDARPSSHAGARLTVHEWGTFTTVAGQDGRAIDWLPLGGPTDLPSFVEHFQNRANVKVAPNAPCPLDYATARSALWGKVRMETPVLYFYAERPTSATVRVRFPRGLMTEWYPHATVTQSLVDRTTLRASNAESVIEWRNVMVVPNASPRLPRDAAESHYYAARSVDAAPLVVGDESEKFLFYRGVASFDVPISAASLGDGSVRIRSLGPDELRAVILFENRDGRIGYRIHGALRGDAVIAPPARDGTVAGIRRELERLLVSAGLFPKEAAAMVESWRDSWFEEGSRVFYLVPRRAVDSILPLTVEPAPSRVERVFVGRMELVTRDMEEAVERAVAVNDAAVLERHGRFLGPITDRILARRRDAVTSERIRSVTDAAFAAYVRRASALGRDRRPALEAAGLASRTERSRPASTTAAQDASRREGSSQCFG